MVRLSAWICLASCSSAFVYETREFDDADFDDSEIADLINSETVGWAVPLGEGTALDPEILVWFSTEYGNFRMDIGDSSAVYDESLVRFSLSSDHTTVMQLLKPDHVLEGPVSTFPGGAEGGRWVIDDRLQIGEPGHVFYGPIEIDFRSDDIWLPVSAMASLSTFLNLDQVRIEGNRIFFFCEDVSPRANMMIGTTVVAALIREVRVPDTDDSTVSLRSSGWCPMNLMISDRDEYPRIGRSILETNDVILDGINQRILVSEKSGVEPATPLVRYRLDNWSVSNGQTSFEWRRSTGELGDTDFVFAKLDIAAREIELICLGEVCEDIVPAEPLDAWVGTPSIRIGADSVSVTDLLGWEKHEMNVIEVGPEIAVKFDACGYRMTRYIENCIQGKRLVFVPVRGPRTDLEFSVPVWPPFRGSTMMISSSRARQMKQKVIGNNKRWHGKPVFETNDAGHIIITADSSVTADDRVVQLITTDSLDMRLDFSLFIRRYRPADDPDSAFQFVPLGRSEVSDYEFEIMMKEGENKDFVETENGAMNLPVRPPVNSNFRAHRVARWHGRWVGEPVISVDPNSGIMRIAPSLDGEVWTYWCAWEKVNSRFPRLVFSALPKRLQIDTEALIDFSSSEWSLKSASGDWATPTAIIRKGSYLTRNPDGSIDLLLEFVDAPIFSSPGPLQYVGRPLIGVDQQGDLVVRSDGDSRYDYEVEIFEEADRSVRVNFRPSAFMAVGSRPVVVSETGDACAICLDDYEVGETVAATFCNHRFHLECLERTRGTACPLCRGSLVLF